MPRERQSITHKFSIGGHEGYITAGMYEDGTVGEIFLTDIGKEGSTLRGMMNAFATAISIALQYGVPLETLVRKFSYMRFEPEGITTNPEIPFAKSMPDYIMRWLASRFLDTEPRRSSGSSRRRSAPARRPRTPPVRSSATPRGRRPSTARATGSRTAARTAVATAVAGAPAAPRPGAGHIGVDRRATGRPGARSGLDLGPACKQCGGMMQRTGTCYTCSSCGNNTGCG